MGVGSSEDRDLFDVRMEGEGDTNFFSFPVTLPQEFEVKLRKQIGDLKGLVVLKSHNSIMLSVCIDTLLLVVIIILN